MKVYVVTSGCYSNYSIDAVFTDPVKARAFANMDSEREVEEYDADSIEIEEAGTKARIHYDPKTNKITSINTNAYLQDRSSPDPDTYMYGRFSVYRKLSARMTADIVKHGEKSPLLLKVMQDAWAQYKAEHMLELERDEEGRWVRVGPEEGAKMMKIRAGQYNILFASTSGTMGDDDDEHDELH